MVHGQEERNAKLLLAAVIVLTLTSSGVSVWFSYIGRDFWTALSTKNEPECVACLLVVVVGWVVGVMGPRPTIRVAGLPA